ncbi:MAG TPA: peptidylprolyl isomerase [Phycisphaerales bacterium]|nr:peptidylprolyl isomerase [Phycisphaerales bacterium]
MDARNAVARNPHIWLALAAVAGAGVGCTGQHGSPRTAGGKSLSLGEFSPAVSGTPAQFVVAAPETKAIVQADTSATTDASTPDSKDLVASPGSPFSGIGASSGDLSTVHAGQPVLVDAKVGDINGRAVYASAIFDYGLAGISPIGAELAAEAKLRPLDNWRSFSRRRIATTLGDLIREELLRAEALQQFTPEQKMGFLGWMEKMQQDFQRARGGSRALADRSLRESEGITIDEWRRRQEDDELVKFQLRERIIGRVNVSFRDIEQRYEREKDHFDPPPRAVFRLAQVNKSRPEDIDAFKSLLGTAASFEDAARSSLNINQPDKGGLEARDLGTKPRVEGEFFPNAALNDAARTMKVGETVGPIELSTTMAWLHLDSEGAKKVPLYEAQLEVEDAVRADRTQRELARYVQALQGKASITDAEQMVERLARIAEARYYVVASPGE